MATVMLVEFLLVVVSFVNLYWSVFSEKMTWAYSLMVTFSCSMVSIGLLSLGWRPCQALPVGMLALPLIFFWIPARYKGARLLFTFCTVGLCGMAVTITSMILVSAMGLPAWAHLPVEALAFMGLWAVERRVRGYYWEINENLKLGWSSMAFMAVLFYGLMYLLLHYIGPIGQDPSVSLMFLYVFVTISMVYFIMFQQIGNMKKNYDYEQSQRVMELELELQSSQLKERELFYRMAYVDALTGLQNRAAMEKRKGEFQEDWEGQQPFVCISLDLNNLKETNDNFGHSEGDSLIRRMGEALRDVFEPEYAAYRIGGDEFLVYCPHTDEEKADSLMQRLYRTVEQGNNSQQGRPVSFAAGLFICKDWREKTLEQIQVIADQRMYEDKERCHRRLGVEPSAARWRGVGQYGRAEDGGPKGGGERGAEGSDARSIWQGH